MEDTFPQKDSLGKLPVISQRNKETNINITKIYVFYLTELRTLSEQHW
jgi:hypothetical protein